MGDPSVRAIATHEWARRRSALLLIGVFVGLVCGVLLVGLEVTRRTDSAPARMLEAVRPGDAQVEVFGDRSLLDGALAVPGVRASWSGGLAVARIDGIGAVVYSGVLAALPDGSSAPGSLHGDAMLRPVLVDGRLPDPSHADEVMVTEDYADAFGLSAGDHLEVSMLSAEEVSQFDVGFGEPDGPHLQLLVAGVGRVPNGLLRSSPVLAGPAFARAHADVFAGYVAYVDLAGGPGALSHYRDAVEAGVTADQAGAGGADFLPVSVEDPLAGTSQLRRGSRILVDALWLSLVIGAGAAAIGLGQALARHQSGSAQQQQIERALGMTALQRVIARVLASMPMAALAGIVAATAAVAGGWIEPVGGLRHAEPHTGLRVDVLVTVGGALLVVLGTLAGVAMSARRAGRRRDDGAVPARSSVWAFVPRRRGWTLTGVAFAISSGGARRRLPVRTSLAGAVLGVAGLVGAVVFAGSLDRLLHTPARYGWTADALVDDVRDADVARFVDDPRLSAVADVETVDSVAVVGANGDGTTTTVHAFVDRRGHVGWTLLSGSWSTADTDAVLGSRPAARLDAGIGDLVRLTDQQTGETFAVHVTGIGIGPSTSGEAFADSMLTTPATLHRVSPTSVFRSAALVVDRDVDQRGAVLDELAATYEVQRRDLPGEVDHVGRLGSLPIVLGLFLAVLALLALAHALIVTTRQRARDLAVMRSIGATPAQVGLTIVAMSACTAIVGIVLGAPLGWAVARYAWGELSRSIGVRSDVLVPATAPLVVLACIAAAAVVSLLPARRVMRADASSALRDE